MSQATPAPAAGATAPSDKIHWLAKLAFSTGGITDLYGHWVYNTLAMSVFNIYLGMPASDVGLALMITRLFDGIVDPVFGWLSDNTRTRFGRRRPYILVGSVLSGLALPAMFMASPNWNHDQMFWFIVVSGLLYAPLISCFNMPYQSLGAEMTPDYHERTSLMSWRAIVQKVAGMGLNGTRVIATLEVFNDATGKPNMLIGSQVACAIAGLLMIAAGLFNFFFVKERYYQAAQKQEKVSVGDAIRGALRNRPFLIVISIGLLFAGPTAMVAQLGYYTVVYHVQHGDLLAAAKLDAYGGIAYSILGGFLGVPITAWISRRIGKELTLKWLLGTGAFSYLVSWWMFTPAMPFLSVVCVGLQGLTATGVWVVLPSMVVDVVDYDEQRTRTRREGVYSSYFSWMLKLGISSSMYVSGKVLDWSGFNSALGGNQSPEALIGMRGAFALLPFIALMTGLVLMFFYGLSESKLSVIRAELEARRGKV
ncbi:MFS transporter [Nibricoccus sp. IMCC34717]|uniref:MFS transporter n=1 Tax=Nibricoccus sp. IMCC34717 TaxID=3034021 RepID=UPI00384EFB2E